MKGVDTTCRLCPPPIHPHLLSPARIICVLEEFSHHLCGLVTAEFSEVEQQSISVCDITDKSPQLDRFKLKASVFRPSVVTFDPSGRLKKLHCVDIMTVFILRVKGQVPTASGASGV